VCTWQSKQQLLHLPHKMLQAHRCLHLHRLYYQHQSTLPAHGATKPPSLQISIGQVANYKIRHCPCVPPVYLPKLHIQVKHVPHHSKWALTSKSLHSGGVANCFQFIKVPESSYCYSISFCIPTGEAYWISVHQRNWGWMAQCLHCRWIHVSTECTSSQKQEYGHLLSLHGTTVIKASGSSGSSQRFFAPSMARFSNYCSNHYTFHSFSILYPHQIVDFSVLQTDSDLHPQEESESKNLSVTLISLV